MAFGLPIRWRRVTRGSAASRDVFLIPKISYIIRHCTFLLQGACIFKEKRHVLFKLQQKTRRRKNLSLNRVFHKLEVKNARGCTCKKTKVYLLHTVFVFMNSSKISLDRPHLILLQITSFRFCLSPFLKNIQQVEQWNVDLFISLIPGALYFENSAK